MQNYFKGYSGTQGMFYQFAIAALMFVPFAPTSFGELGMHNIQLLVVFAIFFSAMAHVLFASSIGLTSARTASLVAYLQPLYGVLLSMLLLAEVPSLMTVLGGVIIVSAAMYETLSKRPK